MQKRKYDPINHGTFDEEWGIHERNKEWWYATGIMYDADKNMYTYQYTLLHINLGIITAKVLMLALTDYKNGKHHYLQVPIARKHNLTINEREVSVPGIMEAHKTDTGINIKLKHRSFSLDAMAEYGKGAVWHCEDGKLQMGIPGAKETTLYYSYPHMPTRATLVLDGKTIELTGTTWFDKQGGTYSLTNYSTNWEWFSLRFFDDEEIMLFTFPQNEPPYFDGTYIRADGSYERFNEYEIKQTKTVEHKGLRWSAGWTLHTGIKDGDYTIEPVQEGHMNFAYFEELCSVRNAAGELVGYAFAELLPGVLNAKKTDGAAGGKVDIRGLFKRIELE